MNINKVFYLLALTFMLSFFVSCSDDESSNPTKAGNEDNPPTVNVEPVAVPQKMQAAANNGNPGATQAMAYIQLANTLPNYAQLLTPPEGAKLSSTSAVNGEWTWTEGNASVTLVTNETVTEYEWTVTIDGTYGGKTYNNQIVIEASQLKDGSSGEILFYDPDSGSPVLTFNWENLSEVYHLNIKSAEEYGNSNVDLYVYTDSSGYIDISTPSNSWHVEWASDGTGSWIAYDANGSVTNEGSWN